MRDGSGTRDFLNRRIGTQAARINHALAQSFPDTRSAVELADAAKAHLGSTRRHLKTLVDQGFVISKERGKYALVRPPPESARRAELPKPHKKTAGIDKIPAIPFHRAFLRFKRMHSVDGHRFVSFRDPESYVYRKEAYKERVAHIAQHELRADTWTRREIGRGHILRRVVAAIEIPKNNLLQWDARFGEIHRAHAPLKTALSSTSRMAEFEDLFFDHFHQRKSGRETFEHLVYLCGRRYELIAYLFFIADWHRYLPIRTRSFDRVFEELEFSLRTERQCSWSNYVDFLRSMELVRRGLVAEGAEAATLLDAHSFCWLLASYGRPREPRSRSFDRNPFRTFHGTLHPGRESVDRATMQHDQARWLLRDDLHIRPGPAIGKDEVGRHRRERTERDQGSGEQRQSQRVRVRCAHEMVYSTSAPTCLGRNAFIRRRASPHRLGERRRGSGHRCPSHSPAPETLTEIPGGTSARPAMVTRRRRISSASRS